MKSCLDCEHHIQYYDNFKIVHWCSKIHGIIQDPEALWDICEYKTPLKEAKQELLPFRGKNGR